jgi:hypothetical protein
VTKSLAVEVGELGAGDIDHQRAEGELHHARSRMT